MTGALSRPIVWLGQWMGRPSFVWWTIAFYVVCGIAFSIAIHWGTVSTDSAGNEIVSSNFIVPDEDRHTAAILYYADRGWWRGPVISHLNSQYLVEGELQREPSFLYYWVMSIVVSALRLITTSYDVAVVVLRLINVAFGALGLFIVWRTLLRTRIGPRTAALAVLALSLTGRYVWQGAGVTYDMPSLLLFFAFVYCAVALLTGGGLHNLFFAAAWAVLVSITKYTYMPFVGVGLVVVILLYWSAVRREGPGRFRADLTASFRDARLRSIGALVLVLVGSVLFVERIVGNLLRFHAVEPDCADVHSAAACSSFLIYQRNVDAKRLYLDGLAHGNAPATFDPFTFTGDWLDRYYRSLYFYLTRDSPLQVSTIAMVLLAIVIVAIIIFIAVNRTPVLVTQAGWFIAGISAAYLVGIYAFNLHTYLSVEKYYAFSGRYILAIMPFAYAAVIRIVVTNWRRVRGAWRPWIGIPLIVVTTVTALVNSTVIAFLTFGRGAGWFEPWVVPLLKKLAGMS
ncbi:MAG TPA: glycosyltransferase family 39 protein [Galbitalea sp.]|jgi:hypothetical protein